MVIKVPILYNLIHLNNSNNIGSGVIGELDEKMEVRSFFKLLKKVMPYSILKHTKLYNKQIKRDVTHAR